MHSIITADQGARQNLVDPEDGIILALEISKGDVPNAPGLAWSTEKRLIGSRLSDFLQTCCSWQPTTRFEGLDTTDRRAAMEMDEFVILSRSYLEISYVYVSPN